MKKTSFWLIGIGLLLAVSVAAVILLHGRAETGTARVLLDGEVLYTIDLSAVEEPYSFTVENGEGSNVVEVERGRIRVAEANCPDQVCVRQSWIADSALPVVCLPHGLVIEITSGGDAPDTVLQ